MLGMHALPPAAPCPPCMKTPEGAASVASSRIASTWLLHAASRGRGSAATPAAISDSSIASTANISPVYIQSVSIAACIRSCDVAVPSPRRITQSPERST